MREVIVLVENLTDEDFQLLGSFVEETETRAVVEPVFRRAVRLRWQCQGGRCAAAVAYGSTGTETSGQASEAAQKLLAITVALPSRPGVGRLLSSFSPSIAPAGARFSATLIVSPTSRRQQGDLRSQLAEAAPLADGASEGCEWRVVRCEEEVVEVRLRVLPPDGALESLGQPLPDEESGDVGEELSADAAEIQRLAGYREVFAALNRQAAEYEAAAKRDVMDLNRLRSLPEKARVDLLLAVLAVLCRRRGLTLSRKEASTRSSGSSEGTHAREVNALDAALSEHVEHVYRAVVPLIGFSEETLRKVLRLARRHLQPASEERGAAELDVPALISSVCDATERCAIPPAALFANEAGTSSAELTASPKKESSAELTASPKKEPSAELTASPKAESAPAAQDSPGKAAAAPAWSADQAWQLGREDDIVRFLGSVRLLDVDLVSSVTGAVDGMNRGRLLCPEACCMVASRSDNSFVALHRAGMEDTALEVLGVTDTRDLSSSQPVEKLDPNEIPLQIVSPFSRSMFADAEAGEESDELEALPPELPRSWLVARELLAVMLGAGGGVFDARSRAALFDLCAGFGVMPKLLARWEAEIGGALFEAMETEHVVEQQNHSRKNWNRGKVAAAAVGGGLLLAVTGGLAAPAVAAGITAVGGATASAGAAVGLGHAGVLVGGVIASGGAALASMGTAGAFLLFGATGAGLTGWKMSRRWGELKEFSFQPLARNIVTKAVIIDVPASDAKAVMRLDSATEAGDGTVQEDVVVTAVGGRDVAVHCGSVLHRRECLAGVLSPTNRSNSTGGRISTSSSSSSSTNRPTSGAAEIVRFHFRREVDVAQRAVHLTIFVTGWLQDEDDFTKPWADVARLCFPSSGHLAIRWETEQLKRLGRMFADMVTTQVASGAASMWIKSSAGVAVATSGVAAMVVAWPVSIISAMTNLDNAWLVVTERARLAGKCLAHVLADRQSVGQRPVTLIGHSLGARLLFYCLIELHDMGEFHAVDDVVLLGTPVATSPQKWQKVREVASGRVINGYLRSDWVLAFFYRYLEWGLSVAGLSEVNVPGVENVNLAGLGIKGHGDYPRHVADIFAKMRVGERDLYWRKDMMVVPDSQRRPAERPARPRQDERLNQSTEVSAFEW